MLTKLKQLIVFPFNGRSRSLAAVMFGVCIVSVSLCGCGLFSSQQKATTLGEGLSGYTYIPIDPTTVEIIASECDFSYSEIVNKKAELLDLLPDNAVRLSMESSDAKGNIIYGVSKIGVSGSAYKLTADYVNSDTVNKIFLIQKTMLMRKTEMLEDDQGNLKAIAHTERKPLIDKDYERSIDYTVAPIWKLFTTPLSGAHEESIPGTEAYNVKSLSAVTPDQIKDLIKNGYVEFSVPIYVGIGLRIVAEGVALSSDAKISGIGVIGAEAEAKRLIGSLTVQTLGITGQAVASALPVQSELSRTTAENAFVAIGSIKSMLHQEATKKFPRVVGLYLPFPGGKPLVNALISELSRNPVRWCPHGSATKDKSAESKK
jgi:hypothetical protein